MDVSGGPKDWVEALTSLLGRKDQSKLSEDSLAGRIVVRVAETKPTGSLLELHTGYLINFPIDNSLDNIALVCNSQLDRIIDRTQQYAMVKANQMRWLRRTGCIIEYVLP